MDVRGIKQKFLWHAAADHAGAAHPVFFGDQDPRAMTGGDPGGANPARTSSDDEQIDVELSHGHPARMLFLTRFRHANRYPLRSKTLSKNQISLPRLRISARNCPLTVSAKLCAHWFI